MVGALYTRWLAEFSDSKERHKGLGSFHSVVSSMSV